MPFGNEVVQVFVLWHFERFESQVVDDQQGHSDQSLEAALKGSCGSSCLHS